MHATEPSVLKVNDLATGSFEWITMKIRLTNSSTFVIFSRCFSLCWQTRSTHNRNKFDPSRKNSASFRKFELMTIGKGYFSNNFGNRTIASHCSPIFVDLSPWNQNWKKLYCEFCFCFISYLYRAPSTPLTHLDKNHWERFRWKCWIVRLLHSWRRKLIIKSRLICKQKVDARAVETLFEISKNR